MRLELADDARHLQHATMQLGLAGAVAANTVDVHAGLARLLGLRLCVKSGLTGHRRAWQSIGTVRLYA